jgi:exocyst complex component 3
LQPSNIEENREWLDDYLTEVASVSYQDLKAMRENGIKCFPPDYDIMDMFLRLYHANIKDVIANLVSQDLNARDIIKLMIWVGDLRQSFREVLGIDLQENGKLIDEKIEGELQKTCVTQVEWNVSELSKKMLQSEAEDWQSLELPDADNTGCFYTTVGILLFEMIDQNVSALTLLGLQTKERVLQVCLEQLQIFQQKYRELIDAKFQEHLKCGRTEPPLFLHYMIAVANNCKSCIEFTERLKKSYTSELGGESSLKRETRELFAKIVDTFDSIGYHW